MSGPCNPISGHSQPLLRGLGTMMPFYHHLRLLTFLLLHQVGLWPHVSRPWRDGSQWSKKSSAQQTHGNGKNDTTNRRMMFGTGLRLAKLSMSPILIASQEVQRDGHELFIQNIPDHIFISRMLDISPAHIVTYELRRSHVPFSLLLTILILFFSDAYSVPRPRDVLVLV